MGAPVEEEFGFGVVEPGAVKFCFDFHTGEVVCVFQMVGNVLVVDGFVHANVEKLLVCFGVIKGAQDGFDEIVDVYEVALYGCVIFIQHDGNGI